MKQRAHPFGEYSADKGEYLTKSLLGGVGVGVLVAVACVPARVWEVPTLIGRVRHGEKPIPAATVTWLTLGSESEGSPVRASGSGITDERGEFTVPGKRAWGVGSLLPADALVRWRVEMAADGRTTVLWQDSMVVPGRRTTPGRIVIDCDTAEEEPCLLLESDQPRLRPTAKRLPRKTESLD